MDDYSLILPEQLSFLILTAKFQIGTKNLYLLRYRE